VSTKFSNSTTRGFAAIGEPNTAVCLLPGTEIAFEKEVAYWRGWFTFRHRRVYEKVARFRRIDSESLNVHHDALEFSNGVVVRVNDLCEGQHATVLQLPATSHESNETVERTPTTVVA
jgi:hypothetical protein